MNRIRSSRAIETEAKRSIELRVQFVKLPRSRNPIERIQLNTIKEKLKEDNNIKQICLTDPDGNS